MFLKIFGIGVLVAVMGESAQAQDPQYFMMIFASQTEPSVPRAAHTFAAFIKTEGVGDLQKDKIEVRTISWLPATLEVAPLRLRPEPGKNLDLAASFAFAKSLNAGVTAWGPFAVKKELYDRAVKQIKLLESGKIAYVVLDRRFRGQGASNCIHAICDVDTDVGYVQTGVGFGIPASEEALAHLRKWIVPTKENLSALYDRLAIPKNIERAAVAKNKD